MKIGDAPALAAQLSGAGAVVIDAGAGLFASAGMTCSGQRFEAAFSDFISKYHFPDMYFGGFYPFSAFTQNQPVRQVMFNVFTDRDLAIYRRLLEN